MNSPKSLKERIVREIESTYTSIATYKSTTKERVEVIEHKLKSLKMMLAKVDDSNYIKCSNCGQTIAIKTLLKNRGIVRCKKCTN